MHAQILRLKNAIAIDAPNAYIFSLILQWIMAAAHGDSAGSSILATEIQGLVSHDRRVHGKFHKKIDAVLGQTATPGSAPATGQAPIDDGITSFINGLDTTVRVLQAAGSWDLTTRRGHAGLRTTNRHR